MEAWAARVMLREDPQGALRAARLEGQVRVILGKSALIADTARWDREEGALWLEGRVRVWRGDDHVEAARARVTLANQEIWLERASGRVGGALPLED